MYLISYNNINKQKNKRKKKLWIFFLGSSTAKWSFEKLSSYQRQLTAAHTQRQLTAAHTQR